MLKTNGGRRLRLRKRCSKMRGKQFEMKRLEDEQRKKDEDERAKEAAGL
jgi:hypothetical protein